jgi:hypothetical protein
MRLAYEFFALVMRTRWSASGVRGSKIFFHRQGREVLARADSSLDSNESVPALIRMREIPDRVCMRRRRVEEGR